ncbi:MAG: acyl-CoA dehydrogenase family protein [Methylococcaceae bacterium]
MSKQSIGFEAIQLSMQHIQKVAAMHAADVDSNGRFPVETIMALKAAGILSAPISPALGGAGCTMKELALLCSSLSCACGSSGMILAMHYSQVASITRHTQDTPYFQAYQREMVEKQLLLASMTSEVGTFGDTRSSICAVEQQNGRFTLTKEATTGSYCAYADAILVTCRANANAPANEQLLVLVHKSDADLTQTSTWDTMGMRGTFSPGYTLTASGLDSQILPCTFAEISAQSMVPYSHILWSSIWWGIAADAVAKAAAYVRSLARKNPGTIPPSATRLAEVSVQLQSMRHNWLALACEFDDITASPRGNEAFEKMDWALKMNNLKIGASELAPQIVHRALQIVGILGYKNDSPYSLSRQYRDVLSASLMISNDCVASKSAAMLLVFKGD